MNCSFINKGLNMKCGTPYRRYFQELVLVNKADVKSYLIQTYQNSTERMNRVRFQLHEGKKGHRFSLPEKGNNLIPSFTKSSDGFRSEYSHRIQTYILGISEDVKYTLRTLDDGDYFGAVKYLDGTVEIYGFQYGLTTNNYEYNPQEQSGGSPLDLISETLEDFPPLIYHSLGNSEEDFDNDFEFNTDPILLGDFNDDFNNDFYI